MTRRKKSHRTHQRKRKHRDRAIHRKRRKKTDKKSNKIPYQYHSTHSQKDNTNNILYRHQQL